MGDYSVPLSLLLLVGSTDISGGTGPTTNNEEETQQSVLTIGLTQL